MSGKEYCPSVSRKVVRYILIGRTGTLAEFETWEQAFHYMATNPMHGGSLVPVRDEPEPEAKQQQAGSFTRDLRR
jgi:hypothetical protein